MYYRIRLQNTDLSDNICRSNIKLEAYRGFQIKPLGVIEADVETLKTIVVVKFIVV